jgi:orotidine-5'-phosphate decarboxylase
MPKLNIAFDGKSREELKKFISENREIFVSKDIHIKLNDLIAEIGIEWVKDLTGEIQSEIWVEIIWMIDGKWYDIPNTVANYVKRLEWLSVAYYTVHASGGPEMIRRSKAAAPEKKLLAITILTSMKDDEVVEIYDADRADSILRLAKLALGAGADGLVCSPADSPMLREVFGDQFLLVTPNIAREWVERHDDQNRSLTNTPRWAIENGVSDIVVGRPILTADHPGEVIREMLEQMNSVSLSLDKRGEGDWVSDFSFERILHTGDWGSLLKYIGAIYIRPEWGKYVRYTSGLIADAYTNMWVSERDYRVLDRAGHDIARGLQDAHITPDLVMGAQMGSVRLSLALARVLQISESIYTEKDGDSMSLKRHDLGSDGLRGKRVILSEDVITKWSTIAKMIEIVRHWGGTVVAVSCIVNRSGTDNFGGIPLIHCYIPAVFTLYRDDETLAKTYANEIATGRTPEEAEKIVESVRTKYAELPKDAQISEKPKNDWNELVISMR